MRVAIRVKGVHFVRRLQKSWCTVMLGELIRH